MNRLERILYKSARFSDLMKDIFSQYGFRMASDYVYYNRNLVPQESLSSYQNPVLSRSPSGKLRKAI